MKMDYNNETVNDLFRNRKYNDSSDFRIESSEKMAELKEEFIQKKPREEWDSFTDKLLDKSPELLDIKLKDILGNAWKKYRQVEQCLEQGKENPDETFLVPMVDHTVLSDHHPEIDIRIDEVPFKRVKFDISLKMELKGIILKIKGSEIVGVKTGTCQCSGSLGCYGITIFEDSSEVIEF
jgi:hypothetical protein